MEESLFSMCVASFMAVFLVLAFLSITMRLIIKVFPERKVEKVLDDAPVFAAISSVYSQLYPGYRVVKIDEEK